MDFHKVQLAMYVFISTLVECIDSGGCYSSHVYQIVETETLLE